MDCFISFCGEDATDVHVEMFVNELRARTSNQINFLVYYEKDYGESLEEFMKETLLASQAVIFLFGPAYKKRVDGTKIYTGAYQEFDTVVTRTQSPTKKSEITYSRPKIIPAIWAGNSFSDAFPQLYQDINPYAVNLSDFRAFGTSTNAPFVPDVTIKKYNKELAKIASILDEHSKNMDAGLLETKAHNLTSLLIPTLRSDSNRPETVEEVLQKKYEHGTYDAVEFKEKFFTSTRFYRRLSKKNVGLISGRKGSGKTTLVQIRELQANERDYFPVIDIEVEDWSLHYLIQNNVFTQANSDFEYADLEIKFFDLVWACFISLSLCSSLYSERSGEDISLSELISHDMTSRDFQRLYRDDNGDRIVNYGSLFMVSVNAAKYFIQGIVDSASSINEETFRIEMIEGVSLKQFLSSLFGPNLHLLKTAIHKKGNKRFLFCLDRFDNEIQKYRKESIERDEEEKGQRVKREIDWLSSLTRFVEKSLRPDRLADDRSIYEFFSIVRFLVILPFDRVVEIRQSQRDSIAGETIEEITWQPRELMTMLRKRIQALYGISIEEIDKKLNHTPEDRFYKCLSIGCSGLPRNVHVSLRHNQHEMELFLDVLRHSFFRPRDIIIYYASILSYYDTMRKRRRKVNVESVRQAISDETRTIVEFEFIGELSDTWSNIQEVLNLFQGREQVMSAKSLEAIIGSMPFEFYSESSHIESFSDKVEFLYEVGFLGYINSRDAGPKKNQEDYTFSFFSRTPPPSFKSTEIMKLLEFAIHPIFIESLFLVVNTKIPVLNLSWEKINSVDRID